MFEQIKDILVEQLGVEESIITEQSDLKNDLGADSLDLFEVIMKLEEEFDLEIPAEDLTDIHTVAEMMDYLKSKGKEE